MVEVAPSEIKTTEVLEWQGLHLLYAPKSTCSQKVAMALKLKNIPFIAHEIDLLGRENTTDWFLGINPRGLVPVLVHDGRVYIESVDILHYLERAFPDSLSLFFPEKAADIDRLLRWEDELHLHRRTFTFGGYMMPMYIVKSVWLKNVEKLKAWLIETDDVKGAEGVSQSKKEQYQHFMQLIKHNGASPAMLRDAFRQWDAFFSQLDSRLQLLTEQSQAIADQNQNQNQDENDEEKGQKTTAASLQKIDLRTDDALQLKCFLNGRVPCASDIGIFITIIRMRLASFPFKYTNVNINTNTVTATKAVFNDALDNGTENTYTTTTNHHSIQQGKHTVQAEEEQNNSTPGKQLSSANKNLNHQCVCACGSPSASSSSSCSHLMKTCPRCPGSKWRIYRYPYLEQWMSRLVHQFAEFKEAHDMQLFPPFARIQYIVYHHLLYLSGRRAIDVLEPNQTPSLLKRLAPTLITGITLLGGVLTTVLWIRQKRRKAYAHKMLQVIQPPLSSLSSSSSASSSSSSSV